MRPKLTAKNLLSNDGLGYVLCHFPKALSFTNAVMRFKTWGTYLGYMLNGTHICFHTTPLISLYIRSNKLVHPNVLRNPGKIISITVPTFEALTQFGAATITTKNIGEVEASYSLTGSILSAALPGLKLAGLNLEIRLNSDSDIPMAIPSIFRENIDLMRRMLLSGIALDEPCLHNCLTHMASEAKQKLQRGKLPISESYYLMGTTDPTGLLENDQVCVILGGGQVTGDVLVYRNPGLHFGDIHVLKATYVESITDVGNASPPRKHTYPVPHGLQSKVSEFSCEQLEQALMQQYLIIRNQSSNIAAAADSWLAFMDRLLILGDNNSCETEHMKKTMLHLVDIYYSTLDAAKSEKKVDFPKELKAELFPQYARMTS